MHAVISIVTNAISQCGFSEQNYSNSDKLIDGLYEIIVHVFVLAKSVVCCRVLNIILLLRRYRKSHIRMNFEPDNTFVKVPHILHINIYYFGCACCCCWDAVMPPNIYNIYNFLRLVTEKNENAWNKTMQYIICHILWSSRR